MKEFLKTKTLDEIVGIMLNYQNSLKEKRATILENPEERRRVLANEIIYHVQVIE